MIDREIHKRWKPLYTDEYRFILYYGGRGGRKSWEVADSLIRNSSSKNLRVLCTREVQDSIKESVYQLLINRARDLGYLDEFRITQNDITHKITDSKFIFKGLNDINDKSTQALKSLEDIDICWIEEAQTITNNSLSVLLPTIRKPGSKIIATFNRLLKNDPIFDLVENKRPRTYSCYVTYLQNPDISEEFIREAEFYRLNKPEDYDHIYLGTPREYIKNSIVKYFTNDNIASICYDDELDLHLSCDFNVDPMMWVIAHKDDDNNFYYLDEIVIENTTTRECVEEFIKRYPAHKGNIIINGDASGDYRKTESEYTNYKIIERMLIDYYRTGKIHYYKDKIQVKTRGFNPPPQKRIQAFNDRVMDIYGERHIYIDNKCKWLLYNINNLQYKEGTTIIDIPTHKQMKTNKETKFLGHIFDAASYLVEFYCPIRGE